MGASKRHLKNKGRDAAAQVFLRLKLRDFRDPITDMGEDVASDSLALGDQPILNPRIQKRSPGA